MDLSKFQKASLEENTLTATYNTIALKEPITVTGEKFVIAVKYTNPTNVTLGLEMNLKSNGGASTAFDYVSSEKGESFLSVDGKTWTDLMELGKDSNLCIKVMTKQVEKEPPKPSEDENNIVENTVEEPNNNQNTTILPGDQDDTLANRILPNAGRISLAVLMIALGTIAIISYINYRRYRIVK